MAVLGLPVGADDDTPSEPICVSIARLADPLILMILSCFHGGRGVTGGLQTLLTVLLHGIWLSSLKEEKINNCAFGGISCLGSR